MKKFFNAIFVLLAQATHDKLVDYVEYLIAENQEYKRLHSKPIRLSKEAKARLLKHGKKLGPDIRQLITIVHPSTFYRWVRDEKEANGEVVPTRKQGRPRIDSYLRLLIKRIAQESGMGYTKIMGELKKLKYDQVSRTTVRNVVKEEGIEPGPDRETGTWAQFIERHAKTLYACDFMSLKSWTLTGAIDLYLLFFIHIESREVFVSPATYHPNNEWMKQQARNFLMDLEDKGSECTILLRDGDKKFSHDFLDILGTEGIKVQQLPIQSPNLNAFAERFVQTIKYECLGRFMLFGQKHTDYLVSEFVDYYHRQRPHQGLGNNLIRPPDESPADGPVVCEKRLGGLIKHYYRKAA